VSDNIPEETTMDEREEKIRNRFGTIYMFTRDDVTDLLDIIDKIRAELDELRHDRDRWKCVADDREGADKSRERAEARETRLEVREIYQRERAEDAETKCVRMECVVATAQKHRIEGCGDPLLIAALDAMAGEGSK